MDSCAKNPSSVRVTNRHVSQLATVSGIPSVLPPTQEDAQKYAVQYREENDDEVIEVGSDSEVDEGFRLELEENRYHPPSSIHGEGGVIRNGDVMGVEERQPAVERVDPFMTPEMADQGRVEDRGRTRTALEIHFGREEEEVDMTGNNVRNQVQPSQTPDHFWDVSPAPASDDGANARRLSTTTHPLYPSSGTIVGNNLTGGEVLRTTVPNYRLWKLDASKTECVWIAGSRQGLRYGPSSAHVLSSVSSAKEQCVNALLERADWLNKLGEGPEWVETPVGITPEKAIKRERIRHSTGAKPGGRGAGATKSESHCCRLACLTLRPPLWDLYLTSKGGVSRSEFDARDIAYRHEFYKQVALAMVEENWKDSNRN